MTKNSSKSFKLIIGIFSNKLDDDSILRDKLTYSHNLPCPLKMAFILGIITSNLLKAIASSLQYHGFNSINKFEGINKHFSQFVSSLYIGINLYLFSAANPQRPETFPDFIIYKYDIILSITSPVTSCCL